MAIEYVLYIVIRTDLGMTRGKVVAQCGHAVQGLLLESPKILLNKYIHGSSAKIALRINSLDEMEEMINKCILHKIPYHQVIDAGLTQVKPNTATVLGIGPVRRDAAPSFIKELKLL